MAGPDAGLHAGPPIAAASGVRHWHGVATAATCARWLALAEDALATAAVHPLPGPGPRDAPPPWPCSLPLDTMPGLLDELRRCLEAHPGIGASLDAALGAPVLLADQCFVRHQPAPSHRRGRQGPHGWHQDGALGFDFLGSGRPPYPAEALLAMQTCWMPLTPWGGAAPSLGWIDPPVPTLVPAPALADEHLDAHLAGLGITPQRRTAEPGAGDVLQFDGATVHRTHATAPMTRHRTSIELRWLPAGPRPARTVRRR